MSYQNILVPTDFSFHARAALDLAIEFGGAFDATVHLIHVFYFEHPPIYVAGDDSYANRIESLLAPIRETAEASLKAIVDEVSQPGRHVAGRCVLGHPAEAILDEANALRADLIVMGTRGRTGLKHLILGSTAERVLRLAPCPVLTVKSND